MKHLQWLFGRAGIYLEEVPGDGGQGGGAPAGGEPTGQPPADKTPDNQPGKTQPASSGEDDPDKTDPGKQPKTSLSDAEAELLRDLMKHKNRSKDLETQLTQLKSALGDLSAEQVAELITQHREAERQALEKRGEYDRIIEQVKTENDRDKAALNEQIAALTAQLQEKDSAVMEMTVGRAFSESAFIRERSLIPASIARKEFGTHVEMVDGQVVIFDKPKGAADRTPLVDGNGRYKGFEDGIAQLFQGHPEAERLLRSTVKPGAGSKTEDLGGKAADAVKQAAGAEVQPGISRISAALKKSSQ